MRRSPVTDGPLLALAVAFVRMTDAASACWRKVSSLAVRLSQRGGLPRLKQRIARLPPAVALPLFLVPELCSRCGWLVSGWLLLQGRAQAALAIYLGSKLIAGLAALWIFRACEPALMRIAWFASLYQTAMRVIAAVRAPVNRNRIRCRAMVRARRTLRLRSGMTAGSGHDNLD